MTAAARRPRWRSRPPLRRRGPGRAVPAAVHAAALLAAGLASACEPPPSPPDALSPDDAALSIRNADLRRTVALLAHDSMRGRGTPSPELEAAAAWVARALRDAGVQPAAGAGYEQRFPFSFGTEGVNVVGRLQGSDRSLRAEVVVLSAHLDHLGVRLPEGGDSIYNGADDNASGVAALVTVAGALGRLRPPPRRTVAFLAFGGEEHDLWGSRHFVHHPTLDLERIVAVLNVDMIGRNFRDSIVAIHGPGSELAAVARGVAARRPELSLRVVEDQWPQEGLFFRSDHWSFARRGIPALLLTSGLHEDYHRSSDEAFRLDYEKTTRVARFLFFLALEVAGGPGEPE